jgi:hypothetical protein
LYLVYLPSKMNLQMVASRWRDHTSHITGAEALPAHTHTHTPLAHSRLGHFAHRSPV